MRTTKVYHVYGGFHKLNTLKKHLDLKRITNKHIIQENYLKILLYNSNQFIVMKDLCNLHNLDYELQGC